MTLTPQAQTVMEQFQVRKSAAQKKKFRAWLCEELQKAGYAPVIEESKDRMSSNVAVGDPESAELLLTAHYDTCAVLPFPNFITPRNLLVYILYQLLICAGMFAMVFLAEFVLHSLFEGFPLWGAMLTAYGILIFCVWWMLGGRANKHTANDNTSGVLTLLEIALALPEQERSRVCFVFFDNEEKGMLGSAAFAKAHQKAKKETLTLNFDCVSDGDSLQLFPSRGLKKDAAALERLEWAFAGAGCKTVEVVRGFGFYPSDNASFKRGVGVCALKHSRLVGWYMDRIHTGRDTVLDTENIRLLRSGVLRLLEQTVEEHPD